MTDFIQTIDIGSTQVTQWELEASHLSVNLDDVALNVSRNVAQAHERLLERWVKRGLPLENADPKWEMIKTDEASVSFRAWIDWRD
jgi:hypothetical protein